MQNGQIPDKDKKRIILSITRFLRDEKSNADLETNDRDSLDVAIQCLEDIYKIDNDAREILEDETLDLREFFPSEDVTVSEEDERKAEEFKNRGNALMTDNDFKTAVEEYTKAIALNPKNPVYFCNRAAAYNKAEQPLNAILDCKTAIKLDPKYSKAYGRMGKAYSEIGLTKEAHEAYLNALKYDPSNEMYQENLKYLDVGQGSDVQNAGLFNNSALFKIILQLMENDSFREVLEKLTTNEADSPYINNLLQMGQVLVNRLQGAETLQQLQRN
ncbi:small glutamine-rich tetratricopeptide repeat-containing protein alpha-like [Coccinella septempunctata]|uniref:small glutamine-rich tetratricopeptide repeat-containing protein alpha-like n=1 Tax=Coccinella septempunctata TaxID=41139 RepID=UPI001D05D317|nr:small glutamine-rich tetratricopeptide repeat-containing protein alpha-like [Coccinella septempunctata]